MRYEKRWANGYWRVFDTHLYTTVRLAGTALECEDMVSYYNRPKK
jgi:hypothetical protein